MVKNFNFKLETNQTIQNHSNVSVFWRWLTPFNLTKPIITCDSFPPPDIT